MFPVGRSSESLQGVSDWHCSPCGALQTKAFWYPLWCEALLPVILLSVQWRTNASSSFSKIMKGEHVNCQGYRQQWLTACREHRDISSLPEGPQSTWATNIGSRNEWTTQNAGIRSLSETHFWLCVPKISALHYNSYFTSCCDKWLHFGISCCLVTTLLLAYSSV